MKRIHQNNDYLLVEGEVYAVGTSDGREFSQMIFTGRKIQRKPMMTFKTLQAGAELVVNPSFHTFSMQEDPHPLPEELESKVDVHIQNKIKGTINGKGKAV